jgi:hypothetical protein
MVQPAESLLSKDPTRSYRTYPAVRCPLLKSEMRSVLMMATNVLGKQSLQMAFIQRNNVVQQVSLAASWLNEVKPPSSFKRIRLPVSTRCSRRTPRKSGSWRFR